MLTLVQRWKDPVTWNEKEGKDWFDPVHWGNGTDPQYTGSNQSSPSFFQRSTSFNMVFTVLTMLKLTFSLPGLGRHVDARAALERPRRQGLVQPCALGERDRPWRRKCRQRNTKNKMARSLRRPKCDGGRVFQILQVRVCPRLVPHIKSCLASDELSAVCPPAFLAMAALQMSRVCVTGEETDLFKTPYPQT